MAEETADIVAQELAFKTSSLVIIETLCFAIINVTALLGNVLVSLAFYRNIRLRTIPNMFVVALALTDILMASLCMPLSVVTLAKGEWVFGMHLCRAHGFEIFAFAQGSLGIMGQISVNRYFRIVRPNRFLVLFTRRRVIILIAVTSFTGITVCAPPFFFEVGFEFQPGKAMCMYNFGSVIAYSIVVEFAFIGVPLMAITVCYAKVYREVSRTNKVFSQENNIERLRANIEEAKITKTLATVMVGFLLCWIPVSVIDVIDMFHNRPTLPRQVYLAYSSLVYLSSTINPFIYGVMNRAFRKEYFRYIKKVLCLNPQEE